MRASFVCAFLVGCGTTHLDVVDLTPTTLGSGLVAHWTFDQTEGTVLFDESDNRRNGIVSGATFTNDGRFGGALHFKPGNSVTVDNFPYFDSSWTFSAWVRIADGDEVTDGFANVINTEVLGQSGWQFQTHGRSSGIYWNFTYWNQGYVTYDCADCFELGRWSHATVVRDATTTLLSYYVDGRLAQPSAPSPSVLRGTSTLYMGKWMEEGRLFSGSIDDVAIYSRALSAAEVAELDMRPPPRPKP
jgi:concanavalin A-like lectin/glucanase superfamily protein